MKSILVTGGTSGIGLAICKQFLSSHFQVFATGRSVITGLKNPLGFTEIQLDVKDPNSIQAAAEYFQSHNIRLNALVNNAGIGIMAPILETEESIAQEVMEVNFWGPIRIMNAFRHLLDPSSCIVNITSIAGNFGLPYRGYYCASKAALDCATESLKMEMRNHGVAVFSLQPGDIQTNIAAGRKMAQLPNDSIFKEEFDFCVGEADKHVAQGLAPEKVAHQVFELVTRGGKKSIYRVAPFLQKITPLVQAILPQATLRGMILKHHQLK